MAVGAIDGTSHEINRPVNNQGLFYSGHRRSHCIHTQIVVDNTGRIRHIDSGFLGHQNDAQQFRLMQEIGIGGQLPFPDNCTLLADEIYPNRHPVITPFSDVQIQTVQGNQRLRALRLNRHVNSYRITVEHAICELKVYRCISSIWKYLRRRLSRTVKECLTSMQEKIQWVNCVISSSRVILIVYSVIVI